MTKFQKLLLLALFLLVIPVGYYFFNRVQMEFRQQDIEKKKVDFFKGNQYSLELCIQNSDDVILQEWNKQCKNENMSENCDLEVDLAKHFEEARKTDYETCYQRYPIK